MIYFYLVLVLVVVMLSYFQIANKYNIIDKPNERSSHTSITIRGGGIIFLISIVAAGIMYSEYYLPVIGAVIIGTISFIDDRITLSSRVRIVFHLIAVSLLFLFLSIFSSITIWGIFALYILFIGIINAYNFMDGINGITGVYSLVVLIGLQYVNLKNYHFIQPDLIWFPLISCLVFLFFNFRKKAKCFAGDVGSITLSFWILLLLFKLILESGNWEYILFLAVYGVDSVLTIVHRLILKQNIFEAHRFHFYQVLANDRKIPHLTVSVIYGVTQALIIIFLLGVDIVIELKFLIVILPLALLYFSKTKLINRPKF